MLFLLRWHGAQFCAFYSIAILKKEDDLSVLILKKSDTVLGLPPAKIVGHEYNQDSILRPCSVAQFAEMCWWPYHHLSLC